MLIGLNHNIMYKGTVYHVQTEDGGTQNPVVTTHLFKGGTIFATKKTPYADIVKTDNLEETVKQIMQDQTRAILKELKAGNYDDAIKQAFG